MKYCLILLIEKQVIAHILSCIQNWFSILKGKSSVILLISLGYFKKKSRKTH